MKSAPEPAPGAEESALLSRSSRWNWTEFGIICAIWTFMALLVATSKLVDPRSSPLENGVVGREMGRAFVTYLYWIVLTPLVFRFIRRYNVERTNWQRRIAMHLAVAVLAAMVAEVWTDFVRVYVIPGQIGHRFPFDPLRDIRRLWFLNELIIYFAILAAGIARDYFSRYQARLAEASRLRTQLVEARLESLRMQLNPHFLFNTLHAVSSLVEHDPRGVRRMIARLSGLLRYTLEESDKQEVTLRQELGFLRDYLDIQRIRFQGRLEVVEDVDEGLLDALLPGLVIQPLVENAIKHGVSKTNGSGLIRIEARRRDDRLEVHISDNGPGLPGPEENGSVASSPGLGLANTRERLQALYGDEHELTLSALPDGGTLARISVPFHTIDDLRATEVEA